MLGLMFVVIATDHRLKGASLRARPLAATVNLAGGDPRLLLLSFH